MAFRKHPMYIYSRPVRHDMPVDYVDVASNRHSLNRECYSPYNGGMAHVGTDGIEVKLIQGIDEEQFRRVCSRAQRSAIGGGLDYDDRDWAEILDGGIQTVLEDFVLVFEVSGVSRACTHQLVRTRKAAFHQQSMRACFYGRTPDVRIPEAIAKNPRARDAFMEAIEAAAYAYKVACDEDIAYQDARFVLPEGTINYIMCEYPLREFLNTYAYRACSMFQWEIMHVFREMGRILVLNHPWLERHVKITCEKTNICEYQGWERVEEQCNFPWAREDNRRYKPEHHKIGAK